MTTIGYIGLGAMGGALARRLAATQPLLVWDINPAAAAVFDQSGVPVAASAADLARRCDVVLLCLPRSSDVRTLVFGPGGLAEGLSVGKLVIDQTSGFPSETREIAAQLAARGILLIDAPVSGGVAGAVAGTISIMVSGADAPCARAWPVLTAISPNVFRCGRTVGDGQAMKLVNNLLSAGGRMAMLEVVAMGRKMGLSLTAMAEVINRGPARNRSSRVTLQALADGVTSPTHFTMSLMLKDMSQAIRLGMECGVPTPLTNAVRGLLQIGVNTMGERAPLDKAVDLIESMAGTRLADDVARVPDPDRAITLPTAATPLRVGYVGLGVMGGALARRLMLTRKLQVFDAQPNAAHAFARDGATVAADLPSLARECDVIFICVPTSAIVREVIFGQGGLAEGLSAGKILVDQTTGDPTVTRAIAADLALLGVALVDAPVTGGPRGAELGTIVIMCGGAAGAVAAVRPIFESISPNIVSCGGSGDGHVAKLVSNALSTCNCLLTYEAASIAVKSGLKLADVAMVINQSTGCSAASERILPALSAGRATADFQMQLMVKDLRLVGRMALDSGAPMLIARTVCSLYEMGLYKLGRTANIDTMAQLYESMADLQFTGA